jgi:hypothetical protein
MGPSGRVFFLCDNRDGDIKEKVARFRTERGLTPHDKLGVIRWKYSSTV